MRTDHASLKNVMELKEVGRRIGRFVDTLRHFNPTIVYINGKSNIVPDLLSRRLDVSGEVIEAYNLEEGRVG